MFKDTRSIPFASCFLIQNNLIYFSAHTFRSFSVATCTMRESQARHPETTEMAQSRWMACAWWYVSGMELKAWGFEHNACTHTFN